jgi:hypothetical protein
MRWDWIPLSASALVVGAMALAFAVVLNPVGPEGDAVETVRTVSMADDRWLAMAVMYFFASVTLTLGLPAILSLFTVRARRFGVVAVSVFAVGVIGTSGYAMLLVFFRALVKNDAIDAGSLDSVARDIGLSVFLIGWVVSFCLGTLLVAIALFMARRTPVWVPVLLLLFVVTLPVAGDIGRVAQVAQVVALAFAFTGIASAAVRGTAQDVVSSAARTGSAQLS